MGEQPGAALDVRVLLGRRVEQAGARSTVNVAPELVLTRCMVPTG
jgi:hypothetical protein